MNIFILKAKSITKQFDISWSFFWECFFSDLRNCHLPMYCDNGHFSVVTYVVKSNLNMLVGLTFLEKKKKKKNKNCAISSLWCHKEYKWSGSWEQ